MTVNSITSFKIDSMRFLLTIATGICIGILIAPDKGSKTRKKVSNVIKALSDRLSDMKGKTDQNEDIIIEETAVILG